MEKVKDDCACMFVYVIQLQWSLSLRHQLIVALADASLIQLNIDMNGPEITVQGRRREVLSPVSEKPPAKSCHLVATDSIATETH